MENMATKKKYLFKCGRWLAVDEDDHEIVREIPAEGETIKKPEPRKHRYSHTAKSMARMQRLKNGC